MFKINCVIDDKKLGQFIWAVDGLTAEPPEIHPLKEPKHHKVKTLVQPQPKVKSHKRKGKAKPAKTNGERTPNQVERIAAYIVSEHLEVVTREQLQKALVAIGGSASSVYALINSLQKSKVIGRRNVKANNYPVKQAKE